MFTTGSKYLYGSAALALVGAFFLAHRHGRAQDRHVLAHRCPQRRLQGPGRRPLRLHACSSRYAGLALLLGAVLSAVRDGDPESGAQLQGLEAAAPVMPVRGSSHWPLVAAFGAAVAVLGLVYKLAALHPRRWSCTGIAAIEWTIHSWADHATGDPAANRKARNRMVNPIEIPLFAIVGIALFVFALSRVLLALDKDFGVAVFGIVPAIAFVVAIILNARPEGLAQHHRGARGHRRPDRAGWRRRRPGARPQGRRAPQGSSRTSTRSRDDRCPRRSTPAPPGRSPDDPPYAQPVAPAAPPATRLGLALAGVLVFAGGCVSNAKQDSLKPHGTYAHTIYNLVVPVFIVAGIVMVLVIGGTLYFAARYRVPTDVPTEGEEFPPQIHGTSAGARLDDRPRGDPAGRRHRHGLHDLQAGRGTAEVGAARRGHRPAVVVGVPLRRQPRRQVRRDRHRQRAGDPRGHQGRPRDLSRDVIHGFWVPELNGKRDVVPGPRPPSSTSPPTTRASTTASAPSSAACRTPTCAFEVIVLSKADYAKWIAHQETPAPSSPRAALAKAGRRRSFARRARGMLTRATGSPHRGPQEEPRCVAGEAPTSPTS